MNSDKPKKGLSPRCKRNLIFTFLIIIFIISILGYKYLLYPSYIERRDRAFFLEYQALMELHKLTNTDEVTRVLDDIALVRKYRMTSDQAGEIWLKEFLKDIMVRSYIKKQLHPEEK